MKRTQLEEVTWTGPTPSPLGVGDIYRSGDLIALASVEPQGRHLSVSATGRYPTWDEIASIKDLIWPDVQMSMILPAGEEYVNVHKTCLHVWELR